MRATVNRVTLLGLVTWEPIVRGEGQTMMVTFAVTTWTEYRDAQGVRQDAVVRHQVVVKNPGIAAFCATRLTKGDRVWVDGRLDYLDARAEIVVGRGEAGRVILLGPEPKEEGA